MCRKKYQEFIKKIDEFDNLGQRINFVLRQITNQCLLFKAKKEVKKKLKGFFRGNIVNWIIV
jgi:hypothetical protein